MGYNKNVFTGAVSENHELCQKGESMCSQPMFDTMTNSLTVVLSSLSLSLDAQLCIRKICSDISSSPLLVVHCAVQFGPNSLAIRFQTDEPERVWTRVFREIYHHPDLGQSIRDEPSSVYWCGLNWWSDALWVYRSDVPVIDPNESFVKRIQCNNCDELFVCGLRLNYGCCPYCKVPIVGETTPRAQSTTNE
jgi:hypothetical protein